MGTAVLTIEGLAETEAELNSRGYKFARQAGHLVSVFANDRDQEAIVKAIPSGKGPNATWKCEVMFV